MDSTDAEPFYNRGIVRDELKDYKAAIEDYSHAIKLNPAFSNAYYNRGIAKHRLGDDKGACEDWEKVGQMGDSGAYEAVKKYCK